MSRKNPFVDPIPGFFSPVFGELLLGGNCETVDADPNADPFDKWVTAANAKICLSNERMHIKRCTFPTPGRYAEPFNSLTRDLCTSLSKTRKRAVGNMAGRGGNH